MNWSALFKPDVPILETIVRGSVTYLAVFALLRLVLKREAGGFSITDLLVIVLVADAVQNAVTGGYNSITSGLLLVATIIFWSFILDWLGHYFPFLGRVFYPPPLPLIEDGQILTRNMRKELITEDELMSQLRQSGVDDIREVRKAFIEGNGKVSVIRKNEGEDDSNRE